MPHGGQDDDVLRAEEGSRVCYRGRHTRAHDGRPSGLPHQPARHHTATHRPGGGAAPGKQPPEGPPGTARPGGEVEERNATKTITKNIKRWCFLDIFSYICHGKGTGTDLVLWQGCGRDVAEALGYKKPENALAQHVEKGDTLKQGTPTTSGIQQMLFINESGLCLST